jgi:enoyl-CoA hydratase/carnithine racemase
MKAQAAESNDLLLRRDRAGVATLTMNRPRQRNALSAGLMAAMQDALDAVAEDKSVKAVVIAGAGPAFCAGHDLREMRDAPAPSGPSRPNDRLAAYEALFAQCSRMMMTITRLPKPVIARVHGMATAAGCQLVATCDLAVASTDARFATPGVNIGLFCSTPAVALSRAVGRKPAMEMLLTGEPIDAEEARRLGLVNRAVAPQRLDAETEALARRVASRSPLTVKIGKDGFYRQLEMSLDDAYAMVSRVMAENMMAQDAEAGIDAFLGKKPEPEWKGR